MKIAYLDCSAGISGDMCLGALVDAGVPLKKIQQGLRALPIKGYELQARKVKRSSIAATKVDVILGTKGRGKRAEGKRWRDIQSLILNSNFPDHLKHRGLRIFKRLFKAEGKVHGEGFSRTHLHELAAVDCMVDIFGTLIGLDLLGVDKVYSSAVNLGSGSVMTTHGRLPVPAPATAELLKGISAYSSGIRFELTTPTGAAIAREVADCCVDLPVMTVERIGYGAGQKDVEEFPNVLRIFCGEEIFRQKSAQLPKVTVIETNIDDMNPQLYEYVMERLFDSGALDAYLTQVIMKKGRPGVLLTVLCHEEKKTDIAELLLRETTTLGVRFYQASRIILEREIRKRETEFGKIKIKASVLSDGTVKRVPEYEDCKRIAQKYKIPLLEVMRRSNSAGGKP